MRACFLRHLHLRWQIHEKITTWSNLFQESKRPVRITLNSSFLVSFHSKKWKLIQLKRDRASFILHENVEFPISNERTETQAELIAPFTSVYYLQRLNQNICTIDCQSKNHYYINSSTKPRELLRKRSASAVGCCLFLLTQANIKV